MTISNVLSPEIESRALMSEELLMVAVLEQALADLQSDCPAVRADAEAYFLAYKADSSAFSLDAVCSQFKLSPAAVRSEVRKRIRAKRRVKPNSVARAA